MGFVLLVRVVGLRKREMRYSVRELNSASMIGDRLHHSFINPWMGHHKEFYLAFCTYFLTAAVVGYLFILPLFQYWVYLKVINNAFVTIAA